MSGIKLPCPSCNHVTFWYTEYNHFGYCFRCEYQEREGSTEVVKIRGNVSAYRALYTELTDHYHKSLLPEHRDYLNKRGITDDTIDHFKLGFCSSKAHTLYKHPLAHESGVVTQHGKPILAGRIVFPYWLYNEVTDIRGRLYAGNGERYLSLLGSTYYRGADYAFNINTKEQEILITEGEIKAIAAWQCGIYAVGLSGILSKRKVSLVDTQKQVICFDSQIPMWHVQQAIDTQAKRLTNPYILTLPLQGKQKQDIDSYVLDFGANNFRRLYTYAYEYQ